jgi:hypothetical protein
MSAGFQTDDVATGLGTQIKAFCNDSSSEVCRACVSASGHFCSNFIWRAARL